MAYLKSKINMCQNEDYCWDCQSSAILSETAENTELEQNDKRDPCCSGCCHSALPPTSVQR